MLRSPKISHRLDLRRVLNLLIININVQQRLAMQLAVGKRLAQLSGWRDFVAHSRCSRLPTSVTLNANCA